MRYGPFLWGVISIFFQAVPAMVLGNNTAPSTAIQAPPIAAASKPAEAQKTAKSPKTVGKKSRRGGCRSYASPSYQRMRARWRKVPNIKKPMYQHGYRDLTLFSVNTGEQIRFFPFLEDGTVDPEVQEQLENLLRDKHTDAAHSIHPRVIYLLYRLAEQLDARIINVISGYREGLNDVNEGNHSFGKAIDINIPGTSLAVLASKAQALGKVGIGFYPVGGFIHLDVRDGPSVFWEDRSGPGSPSCYRRVRKAAAAKQDRKYEETDDKPKIRLDKSGTLLHTVDAEPVPKNIAQAADATVSPKKSL